MINFISFKSVRVCGKEKVIKLFYVVLRKFRNFECP